MDLRQYSEFGQAHGACGLVQPIAGADKVVGGGKIVGGIRNHGAPSIVPRTRLERAHQAQLKAASWYFRSTSDATEIPRIVDMCRRNDTGEGHRDRLAIRSHQCP